MGKNIFTSRMKTFDTAKESLDPILSLNLTMLHDFFFRFPSAKFKKKKNLSVGMLIITWTWNEQKRITNGEQRHFGVTEKRPPPLEIRGDFEEKSLKKN